MTSHLRRTILAVGAVLMLGASVATADEWDHKTIVTINEPMVVPGATLEPGTYIFTLADDNGSRSVVNIFRESGALVTTAKTVRMERNSQKRDLVLAVALAGNGAAPMMKGWYYPGTSGHEFLYPKAQARTMARAETVEITVAPRS